MTGHLLFAPSTRTALQDRTRLLLHTTLSQAIDTRHKLIMAIIRGIQPRSSIEMVTTLATLIRPGDQKKNELLRRGRDNRVDWLI